MGKQASTAEFVQSMEFDRSGYSDQELIDLYKAILMPRMIEDKMLILLRQGRVSKWFSGIGQEAVAVGATLALQSKDYILPLHRNLGVFHQPGHEPHPVVCPMAGQA
jgi:2-oxoisovalerate dehydrogenase E1 component